MIWTVANPSFVYFVFVLVCLSVDCLLVGRVACRFMVSHLVGLLVGRLVVQLVNFLDARVVGPRMSQRTLAILHGSNSSEDTMVCLNSSSLEAELNPKSALLLCSFVHALLSCFCCVFFFFFSSVACVSLAHCSRWILVLF